MVGEQLAVRKNPASIIVRTSWGFFQFCNKLLKKIMRLMRQRESLNVVDDQVGSPTYAADLAKAIMQLIMCIDAPNKIAGDKTSQPAIFHYSNEGVISWYEFAEAIRELTKSKCKVNPIPTSQYPTPAKRPHFSLLDKSKIKTFLSLSIPGWRESLQKCIQR